MSVEGLALTPKALHGLIAMCQVDGFQGFADKLCARVLVGKHQIPDVIGTVEVVVVHLRQQRSVGLLRRLIEDGPKRLVTAHADHANGQRQASDEPFYFRFLESVAVQRQHELQPRVVLPRNVSDSPAEKTRTFRGQQNRYGGQLGRIIQHRFAHLPCPAAKRVFA